MTLDHVRPTQFSVIQIIYRNVGLKCFCFYLPKCLFVIIMLYLYFSRLCRDPFALWWDV